MPSNPNWPGTEERAEVVVQGAVERLSGAKDELVVDFSAVRRIDPAALRQIEELAAAAHERAVKLVLRGVQVEVYKVLKLVAATPQFSFVS
jgi:anti-anti-sigma regulatory factor